MNEFGENCFGEDGAPEGCVVAASYEPSGLDYLFQLAGKTRG